MHDVGFAPAPLLAEAAAGVGRAGRAWGFVAGRLYAALRKRPCPPKFPHAVGSGAWVGGLRSDPASLGSSLVALIGVCKLPSRLI